MVSFREICVQCGQRAAVHQHLCPNCFAQAHPIVADSFSIKISACSSCFTIQAGSSWSSPHKSPQTQLFMKTLENAIISAIKQSWRLNFSPTIQILQCELISFPAVPRPVEIRGSCQLIGQLDAFSPSVEETHPFDGEFKWTICEDCQAIRTQSYQAKVQVRGLRDDELDGFANEVADIVDRLETQAVSGAFISKVEQVKGGLDLYLGSRKLAVEISKHFRSVHCSTVVQTAESTGGYDLQRSRYRYRAVLSVRLPSFREGDIIQFQARFFQVQQFLSGGRARLFDLKKTKTIAVEASQFEKNPPALIRTLADVEAFQILALEEPEVALVQRQSDFETFYVRIPPSLAESEGEIVQGFTADTGEVFLLPFQNSGILE
ncbi:MAG: NMD3-related protein [Candidatus Hodarchaeales archaeon]